MLCPKSGKQTQEATLHFYKSVSSLQVRTPISLERQDLPSIAVQQAENSSACLERIRAFLLSSYTQAVACADPRAHTSVLGRLVLIIYSHALEGMLSACAFIAPLDLSCNCSSYAYHF